MNTPPLYLCLLSAATLALAPSCSTRDARLPPAEVTQPASYVNPFVGSGGNGFKHGANSPAALAPNGFVKVGPDTNGPYGLAVFLHYSGYWYGDDRIRGFSQIRLMGTGTGDLGLLSLMPVPAFKTEHLAADGRESTFSKATEVASPGYYATTLDQGGIRVELTASTRVAHHRYTFGKGAATGDVVFDLDHILAGGRVRDAQLTLIPAERRFEGALTSSGPMTGRYGGFTLYFAGRTRASWLESTTWSGEGLRPGGIQTSGPRIGAALKFDVSSGAPVELQVALSMVSAAQARKNLETETPTFDFEGLRAQTRAQWDSLLSRVKVTGGSEPQRARFYTALYQAFLMPSIQSDVDGQYRGFDGAVHTAVGHQSLSDLSMWDTYRTTHPLYAWLFPERARDAVRSLLNMARESGELPKWACGPGDSGSMIGAPAEIVIADAYLRGVADFDAREAYDRMRAAALDPTPPPRGRGGRENFDTYARLGYVTNDQGGSVSRTGEYAHADFALGNLATALGQRADAERLHTRSRGYRSLFDPESQLMRGRSPMGAFTDPFDPVRMAVSEYVEANAWQSSWIGTHDFDGFARLFGGDEGLVRKLTAFFENAKHEEDTRDPNDMISALLPPSYYWHGNEPDIHAAYLFTMAGRPELTTDWVSWILRTHYALEPAGLAGNDDGGTLSSWYVFSSIGLYPIAGTDQFIVGAPRFPKLRLSMGNRELVIEATGLSEVNRYVQHVELNGAPWTSATLPHSEVGANATLRFTMGPTPTRWVRR